ncbi:MAG: hypothetical protein WA109_04295 [Bellilinea sp.]
MKNRLTMVILIALLITLLAGACKPTPTPTPPTETPAPPPPTLTPIPPTAIPPTVTPTDTPTEVPAGEAIIFTRLDMITATTGWALSTATVVRTSDGGATWTEVAPADWNDAGLPTSAFFQNEDHAWLVQTDPVDFERGVFYHTSDGGASWKRYDVPFGAGTMSFVDNVNGWIMVGLGAGAGSQAIAIFATRNGGATWTETYRRDSGEPEPAGEIPLSGSKQGITFRDLQHGWVAGSVPADNVVYLYATQNGGVNFQQQDIPMPTGITTAMLSLEAPIFYTTSDGVLPVLLFTPDASATVFYATDDGGLSWTPTSPVPVLGSYSAPSPDNFIVWDGNTLYHSSDQGQSWDAVTPNINLEEMIAALDFVDEQNGWVTWMDGDGNAGLYRTTDGGQTWTVPAP